MRFFILACCFLPLFACSSFRHGDRRLQKHLKREIGRSPVFSRAYTGFYLADATTGRELCAVNADRYFTPASNTKILTLATCLNLLGDSLPGLKWAIVRDTLFFRGTGDPTFLHPVFEAWQPAIRLLRQNRLPAVYLPFEPDNIPRFGPGWAWDDYSDDYSAERSAMPAYGNVVWLSKKKGAHTQVVAPPGFSRLNEFQADSLKSPHIIRTETGNAISVGYDSLFTDSIEFDRAVPLYLGEHAAAPLLLFPPDSLNGLNWERETGRQSPGIWHTLYSVPVDTVYRRMMYESDNFVAEQLLLLCAGIKYDTLQTDALIGWVKDSLFAGLPNPPRWVDGSGLSRYNLVTPRYLGSVLRLLYGKHGPERLFPLFPAGGISGTLANWYIGATGKPFVFAKSGSMSGVQCLSGYLRTSSGRVLVFSFMHNNFVGSGKPWKAEMQRILLKIAG